MIRTVEYQPKNGYGENARSEGTLEVVHLKDMCELRRHEQPIQELANVAMERNVFYSPALLFPAIEAFGETSRLEFILVYATGDEKPILTGFFPLESRHSGFAFQYYGLWQYDCCYLCTPLIHACRSRETLDAFLDHMATLSNLPIKIEHMTGDGAVARLLADVLRCRENAFWISKRFTRAYLERLPSWEEYERNYVSKNFRKKVRRARRQLESMGDLQHVELTDKCDVDRWIERFLDLESSGWKGRQRSAMKNDMRSRIFLTQAVKNAFDTEQLMMTALELDGQPVAMNCDFLDGSGGFGFKSAYDERFAPQSPGILLECLVLQLMHDRQQIDWMDSCAAADHSVFNRLWNKRRRIGSLWISTGNHLSDFAIKLMPAFKLFKQRLRSISNP